MYCPNQFGLGIFFIFTDEMMNITIGILIPRSDIFPQFSQQVVKGIKLAFENAGMQPRFIVEDIGKAVIQDVVMAKANGLLMQDVDITIAYAGKKVLDDIKLLFKNSKKPLMLMGMGPNILRDEEFGESPYIAANSFDLWETTYLLGRYAANNMGANGVASIGLFEGGYQFLPVFNEAVEDAGGKIVATHITKKLEEADFSVELDKLINEKAPDYIAEFYTGIDDERFYEVCVQPGISKGLPILTTSLGVEPFAGTPHRVVHGLSWQPFVANEANKKLNDTYQDKHGNPPDAYVALAYETALWIIEGLKGQNEGFDIDKYCEAISNAEFDSPRGRFTVNKGTNGNNPFPTTIVDGGLITEHTLELELKAEIEAKFAERLMGGWFNPYPCA